MSTVLDAEAEALRNLMGDRNRADFAREHGVPGGPSMIAQHLSGHRPISLDAGVAYARGFRVPLNVISPRLAAIVRDAAATLDPPAGTSLAPPAARHAAPVSLSDALARITRAVASLTGLRRALARTALHSAVDDPTICAQAAAELQRLLDEEAAAAAGPAGKRTGT